MYHLLVTTLMGYVLVSILHALRTIPTEQLSLSLAAEGCFEAAPNHPTYKLLRDHDICTCRGYLDFEMSRGGS